MVYWKQLRLLLYCTLLVCGSAVLKNSKKRNTGGPSSTSQPRRLRRPPFDMVCLHKWGVAPYLSRIRGHMGVSCPTIPPIFALQRTRSNVCFLEVLQHCRFQLMRILFLFLLCWLLAVRDAKNILRSRSLVFFCCWCDIFFVAWTNKNISRRQVKDSSALS